MASQPQRPPLSTPRPLPPPINRSFEDKVAATTLDVLSQKIAEHLRPPTTVEQRRVHAEARAAENEFPSAPEYVRALMRYRAPGGGELDPRLARLVRAPTGGSEADPTSGGFATATVFVDEVKLSIYQQADVTPHVTTITTDHPADVQLCYIDETSRADGSGGAASYWVGEGTTTVTQSFPRVGALKLAASKLLAICVMSNELLRDLPTATAFLIKVLGGELAFQCDKAILRGTGAGQPLGVVNSPACISVAKQNGQVSGTIVAENVRDMWSRMAAPCRKNAIWFANEDVEGQLEGFTTPSATAIYTPQGVGGNAVALLRGRPLYYSEAPPALGTPGDLILMDPTEYVLIDGGFKSSLSLDVSFTTDSAIFKMSWRGSGAPWRVAPITPANGSATRSPYVTIAQR